MSRRLEAAAQLIDEGGLGPREQLAYAMKQMLYAANRGDLIPPPLPPALAWAAGASMATPLSVMLTPSGMTAAISAIALLRASKDDSDVRFACLYIYRSLQWIRFKPDAIAVRRGGTLGCVV